MKLSEYYTKRQYYIELLGGKCIDCNSISDLEFDHIDPKDKLLNVSTIITYNKELVLKELQKCVLRCRECHKKKTIREKTISQHGQGAMVNKCGPPRCNLCRQYKREYMRKFRSTRIRIKDTYIQKT